MARLRDIPVIFRRVGPLRFARRVYAEVCDDHVFLFSAALAYAWLFAVFPLLIFLANIAPYVLHADADVREEQVTFLLETTLPVPAVQAILQGPIVRAIREPQGTVLSLSLLIALWAASNGMAMTMAVLDKCYEIERPRAYYKRRPMAFFLTGASVLLLMGVLILLPVGRAFREWYFDGGSTTTGGFDPVLVAFEFGRVSLAVALIFLILALIYHFGPCVKHRFRWITPGAVFTVAGWCALHAGFKLYVAWYAREGYDRTYGDLAGVAILLVLFYLDALVMLGGAEINSEIDFEMLGVKRGTRDLRSAEGQAPSPTVDERSALAPSPSGRGSG